MSRRWLLTAGTFILIGGLLLLLYSRQTVMKSRVDPLGLAVGEALTYADSTSGATSWHWEFGQGSTSAAAQGIFRYPAPGTYLVRLTVNGHLSRLFTVRVKPALVHRDSTIRLLAPTVGYQDEQLTFQTFGGPAHRFTWQFGDGALASHDPTAFHAYAKPGVYRVQLTTDVARRVLVQTIKVLPRYSPFVRPTDTTGDDFRWRLQRIADGQQFNQQYSYLLSRYLCGKADAQVLAGGQPAKDFYSYCMNLQFDPGWHIDAVASEPAAPACMTKLVITQHKDE